MSGLKIILFVFGCAMVVAVLINALIHRYYWRDFERRRKGKGKP